MNPGTNTASRFLASRRVLFGYLAAFLSLLFAPVGHTHNVCTEKVAENLTDVEKTLFLSGVMKNEFDYKFDKLLWWNRHEKFLSLGIGHFIWYPKGEERRFVQRFPDLIAYLEENHVDVPKEFSRNKATHCPWRNHNEFQTARGSKLFIKLELLLLSTMDLQFRYLFEEFLDELETICNSLIAADNLPNMFRESKASPLSTIEKFSLFDYWVFKGSGLSELERYSDRGWGLLQVLKKLAAKRGRTSIDDFVDAAEDVLKQRVQNSPVWYGEQRWLNGWLIRVRNYPYVHIYAGIT